MDGVLCFLRSSSISLESIEGMAYIVIMETNDSNEAEFDECYRIPLKNSIHSLPFVLFV